MEVDSGLRNKILVESGVDSGYIFRNFKKVEVESGSFFGKSSKVSGSGKWKSGKVESTDPLR